MQMSVKACLAAVAASARWAGVLFAADPALVSIEQDRVDGLYAVGDEAVFTVSVSGDDGALVRSGTVAWTLDNFGAVRISSGEADLLKGNPFTVRGKMDEPGFLRLTVNSGKKPFVWSVGYDVDKIVQTHPRPADFDEYWASEKARLAREVEPDAKDEVDKTSVHLPWELHRISFATFNGRRVYGFMTIPHDRTRAPFRARIRVCDAGSGAIGPWEANTNEVTVTMNVHAYEPARSAAEQEALMAAEKEEWAAKCGLPKGSSYSICGIGGLREDYFFHDAILGIDRAVDWIARHPAVDAKRVVYYGSSQGGGFGLYLAGINPHFAAVCVAVPACTGHYGAEQGRQPGWPNLIARQPEGLRAAATRNAAYYDGVNFAVGIDKPIRFVVGFSDTTCPPPDVYAAFNACPSKDKAIVNAIGSPHGGFDKWIRENRGAPSWLDYNEWLRQW